MQQVQLTFNQLAEAALELGATLSFLNTVRTERFDQVLAIKLVGDRASRIPSCVGCVRNREAAAGEESAMTHRMAKILAV
jgi:hypothetical protein